MKRTGQSKIAVVGWGRGMGHKGHMYLADAVITQAKAMGADPYFFVSKTVGKDDPIYPEEKVRIYQKVFPQHATIFTPQGNLNQALEQLAQLGYEGAVVVVGADQKQAFQYLERPGKDGVPIYQQLGFKKLRVISRQETRSQFAREEGPRATPMREILLDPNASEEDKFKVWRRDMPDQLGDNDVLAVMRKAESRLVDMNAPKKSKLKAMSTKAAKLKEAIAYFKTKAQPNQEPKKPESEPLGYKHLFKSDEPKEPTQPRFHGWEEYEKSHDVELKEFSPGNGDDDDRDYEYEVYQCNPLDQFDWIGGPIYKSDDMGKVHGVAYELWKKHPDKAFMVWQERSQGSRGRYGPKDDEDLDEGIFGLGGPALGAPLASTNEYNRLGGASKLRHDAHVALKMVDSLKHTNHNGYYDEEIKKYLRQAQEYLTKAKELEGQQGVAEGLNDKPEAGDKITWYYSNQYPEIEGEVAGWKDGHLIVKSIDPSPRNTEKTVATYRVPTNNILSIAKQGVDEAYDGFGKFDAAEFQRHMEKLRAREELRKTDPMRALVGDLKDQDAEKAAAIARRKKPEDDSMSINDPRHPGAAYTQGNQNIDEVSDKTLMSYLTKVDADSRKHKMDPTKRDPKKASKSVSGFSKAFNKLDSRKPDGTVSEDYLDE